MRNCKSPCPEKSILPSGSEHQGLQLPVPKPMIRNYFEQLTVFVFQNEIQSVTYKQAKIFSSYMP